MKIFLVTQFQYLRQFKKYLESLNDIYEFKFIVYGTSEIQSRYDFEYYKFSNGKKMEDFILSCFSIDKDYLFNFNVLHIYSDNIINLLGNRLFNFHNSPLPKYKGINSVNWGLFNNEIEWGITWHKITSKIDSGDIVFQKLFKIPPNIYQLDLIDYCFLIGIRTIKETIKNISIEKKFLPLNPTNTQNDFLSYSVQPKLIIRNHEDVFSVERFQPFTSIKKFRWEINIKDISCTLISKEKFFRNRLELNKFIYINDYKIFYAD